jgi:hypothetical protein
MERYLGLVRAARIDGSSWGGLVLNPPGISDGMPMELLVR